MSGIVIELDNSHRINFHPTELLVRDVKIDLTTEGVKYRSSHIEMTIPLDSCHASDDTEPVREQLFTHKIQKIIAPGVDGQIHLFENIRMRSYSSNAENGYVQMVCQND